jgi:glutaredoxin
MNNLKEFILHLLLGLVVIVVSLLITSVVYAMPTLYTSPTCEWCHMIKHELAVAHIKYQERPASQSPANVVPVLKEDSGKIDVGYDQIHEWIQEHL